MSIRQKRFDTTRYGFKEGDRVRTRKEYDGKPFRGTVQGFFRGLAFIKKEDGSIHAFIHPYWLEAEK